MGDKNRGLYNKYEVYRTDDKHLPGEKHENCDYFVLDLTHDPFAQAALETYAAECQREYPKLADDLWAMLDEIYDNEN